MVKKYIKNYILMLDLGFPRAEYRRSVCNDSRICVTMLFNTLMFSLKGKELEKQS